MSSPVLKVFISGLALVVSSLSGAPAFLLGLDSSEWAPSNITRMLTDRDGSIYLLSSSGITGSNTPPSTVFKLSPDGKTLLWQSNLGIAVTTMAVDPGGGVYITPLNIAGAISVAKLKSDGSGIAWTQVTSLTPPFGFLPVLAADATGRAYVAGFEGSTSKIVRLNAAGSGVDYSRTFSGMPSSIAIDESGGAFVAGVAGSGLFLMRLASDGSSSFYSTATQLGAQPSVALDPKGVAVLYGGKFIDRFDSSGVLLSSTAVPAWDLSYPGLALDENGNAYITGSTANRFSGVKNTLAPCGTEQLSVIAPDGSILQTTYIGGAARLAAFLPLAIGRNATVFLAPSSASAFAPSSAGPFSKSSSFLVQFSPHADAQVLPLACAVNGASFERGSMAPGEVVTVFGKGLGPTIGVEGHATPRAPYPISLSQVQVTVNGLPSALLWVQDEQINFLAPWSLVNGTTAQICVSYNGAKTNCLDAAVSATAPAVFTLDGVHAAVLNQDQTLNSATNPAAANSIVSVYATGMGPISPAQADGAVITIPLPVNLQSIGVDFAASSTFPPGGYTFVPREITYAGPAPNLAAGISQINFRVAASPGAYVVRVGEVRSDVFFQLYVAQP